MPTLLATKLSFPQARRDLVPRQHLIERLNTGLKGPLTLVSAPAGYGKTTIMNEWRDQPGNDMPVAWLSLDEEDNDLPRFLFYLAAAFETVRPGLVSDTLSLLQSPPLPSLEPFLTVLINQISSLDGPLILVFDDYFLIHSPAVHESLAFILAHLPSALHLVILTREDPPLPLPRLRARGELTEIRESDLRFSTNETASFLSQTMRLDLSGPAIAMLVQRTEGWIAGLQMAALAIQSQVASKNRVDVEEFIAAFRGDDRFVMDYLMEEVFRRQPENIQKFLINTSIADRLCASLCDDLIGNEEEHAGSASPRSNFPLTDSQAILEYLERANMFLLSLDNRREWYCYHPLFADLLLYRLKREQPDRIADLHRRASSWFLREGYPDESMKNALAVPDSRLAADVAEQFMLQMTGSSRLSAYLNWLREIPDTEIISRAYLCVGCGWAYGLTYQIEPAQKYLQAAEIALGHYQPIYSQPDRRWISKAEVQGSLEAIRSYLYRDKPQSAIQHAQLALEALPEDAHATRCAVSLNLGILYYDSRELEKAQHYLVEAREASMRPGGNIYVATSAFRVLGAIAALQGRLNEAEGYFQRSISIGTNNVGTTVPIPSVGATQLWLVYLHYQRNEIEAAQEHLSLALPMAQQLGVPEADIRAYLYQSLLAQWHQDWKTARESLAQAEEWMQARLVADTIKTEWLAVRGQLYLSLGDLTSTQKLLDTQGILLTDLEQRHAPSEANAPAFRAHLPGYLLLARLMLAQGDSGGATRVLEALDLILEAAPEFPVWLEVLVLKAVLALDRKSDGGKALVYLERALSLAAPEGFVQPFLLGGRQVTKLLRMAIVQDIQPAYAQKLLEAFAEQERQSTIAETPADPASFGKALIEPLTGREKQILRLLAAGLSSTEIAKELYLSVSTTRSYIKILYQKLDAHSRDEATEIGRQFGLV